MNKNILILYNIFTNGGGETNLLNLLKNFKDEYNFTLGIKRFNENTHLFKFIKSNRIKIVTCSFPSPIAMSKIKLLCSLFFWPLKIGIKKFDLIISIEISRFTPIYKKIFLKKTGQFIWTPIGNPDHIVNIMMKYKNYIKYLDLVIVESKIHFNKLKNIFPENSIKIINSFCFSNFSSTKNHIDYSLKQDIVIGYLGRYDKAKGIIDLLEIFNDLIKSDNKLFLSYYGNHGDSREELELKVIEYGLMNKVSINDGWNNEDEYEKILNKVDFIVLPSQSEGLPLILLESMAFGNPFVATNVGAVSELGENNFDVVIVDPGYESIKQGIKKMIDRLRKNEINHERLKQYFNYKYGPKKILSDWKDILSI